MSPAYTPAGVAVADDGGVYAVACLRGGGEHGEDWHRAGMRERKQQVFDDFAAAADWLVAQGRTRRERLAVRGGSNGGLLVAATITQRPDLCRAAVCAVPLTAWCASTLPHRRLWTPGTATRRPEDPLAVSVLALPPRGRGHHTRRRWSSAAIDSRRRPRPQLGSLAWAAAGDGQPVLAVEPAPVTARQAGVKQAEGADVHTFLRWQMGGA